MVKGHRGAKAAARQVAAARAGNRFVLRTDVKWYYASIDHLLLTDRLTGRIREPGILNLLGQYLRRTAESSRRSCASPDATGACCASAGSGGWFWDHERGISRGCPLNPLIGAFFLEELDRRISETGLLVWAKLIEARPDR